MSPAPAGSRGKSRLRPKLTEVRARIDAYMREKGLHSTNPRRLIIDEFLSSHEHVTLDDMAARVRGRDASIGFTTVYRTLRLLVECGIAEERQFGDRMTRYELVTLEAHHDHLICTECGKILEFHEPRIESLQDEVATRFGFHQRTHKLEIYGECAACGGGSPGQDQNNSKVASGGRRPRSTKERRRTS